MCVRDLSEHSWIENNRIPVEEHLSTCTSKHENRFVSLFSNKNQLTKLIRVVDKVEEGSVMWVREDFQVSNDVFKYCS